MSFERMLFILSIIGIITLLFYVNIFQEEQTGTITSIDYSQNKITLHIQERDEPLIIFENILLNLEIGDNVVFIAKEDEYHGESQLIVNKLFSASK